MTWPAPETIPHRPRVPALALLALFTAIGLVLTGTSFPGPCLFAGVVLGVVAVGLAWSGTRTVPLGLRPHGLEPADGSPAVPYGDLCFVGFTGRSRVDPASQEGSRYLLVGHPGGLWRVPRTPDLDRRELCRWLRQRAGPERPGEDLPAALEAVRVRETERFGPEKVLAAAGRPPCPADGRPARWVACLAGAWALTAVAGHALGASRRHAVAMGAIAGVVAVLALLVGILQRRERARLARRRAGSGIVVTPRGLTVDGADLRGEMLWAEVRGYRLVDSTLPRLRRLKFRMEGTTVLLGDEYRVPFAEIAGVVERYLSAG